MKECCIPVPVEVSEVLLRHIGRKGLNGAKIGEESVLKIYEMEGLWGAVRMLRTPCSYRSLAWWWSAPKVGLLSHLLHVNQAIYCVRYREDVVCSVGSS